MHLVRCSAQKSETLDEFYIDLAKHETDPCNRIGKTMLSLLKRLREIPGDRRIWGLTSHAKLLLLAHDDYTTPWYVSVIGSDMNMYFVEYLMPEAIAPWGGAYVRGERFTEDEALEIVLVAMERSGGWAQST